jgi:hypothetical protein
MHKFVRYHRLNSSIFLTKVANMQRPSVDARWMSLLSKLNEKYHFTGVAAMMMPDVSRMKVKKITVKDKGALQNNIREGKRRLNNDY